MAIPTPTWRDGDCGPSRFGLSSLLHDPDINLFTAALVSLFDMYRPCDLSFLKIGSLFLSQIVELIKIAVHYFWQFKHLKDLLIHL